MSTDVSGKIFYHKIVKYYVCFVYHTVKLFLYTRGVSDRKRSGWPCSYAWFICHRLLMLLGHELTEILSENKKHGSGNG
jgi:hypothetical protein